MRKILFTLFILTTLGLAACGASGRTGTAETSATLAPVPASYSGKTNPSDASAATAGAAVFKSNCAVCHGPKGHGDGPAGTTLDPSPKNLAELSTIATDDYLFWRISTGKDGTAMVAWKGVLSDEQIWQLVSFIRTLK